MRYTAERFVTPAQSEEEYVAVYSRLLLYYHPAVAAVLAASAIVASPRVPKTARTFRYKRRIPYYDEKEWPWPS